MNHPVPTRNRAYFLQDRTYHELRVLLLVRSVADVPSGPGHVDGLGQLAKLDFLVRYPLFAARVLEELDPADPRLHHEDADARTVEAPMRRHRYGPWDERYYTVVGALLGRGLLVRGTEGRSRMTLAANGPGREVARAASRTPVWMPVADRCTAVAEAAHRLSGNHLGRLIRERLSLDEDHDFGDVIT
ncbi:hypothetical protein [Nocardiopsis aegyptia]|uniref:Uncharacterized protein n=1 Tax=Nocardiopsis aegyptia TaxID=220378 RepID=A0A7Z0EJ22_9ACTN|nr:hypothetical protein [Nocardiopsis aegyptia]NYJ33022.1 hypothetical protein [Nocardiopsis aegyptia]